MSTGILINGEIGTYNLLEFEVMLAKGTSRLFVLHLVMLHLYYTSDGRRSLVGPLSETDK